MAYVAQDQSDNNFNQASQNAGSGSNTSSNQAQTPTTPSSTSSAGSTAPTGSSSTGGGSSVNSASGSTGAGSQSGSIQSTASNPPNSNKPINEDNTTDKSSSGNFTNLQNYIKANQGYNNGQGLAGQTYDNLNNKTQDAQTQVDQSSQQFQQQANAAEKSYDPNYINNALANASSFASNANNVSNFQNNYLNAAYTGPTALSNGQQLTQNAQNVNNLTNQVGTESGRYALLQNLYGGANYNTGQQQLDNLLLQGDPNQLAKLQSASALGTNLVNNTTNAINNANTTGQQYNTEAQNTATQTAAALNNTVNTDEQNIIDKTAALNAQRTQQYQDALSQLTSGQVSQNLADQLGLTGNTNLYNTQLQNYLSPDYATATNNNVATAADQATFQALGQLANQQNISNFVTPNSDLGSAVNINTPQLQSDLLNNTIQAYNNFFKAGGYDFSFNPSGTNLTGLPLQQSLSSYLNGVPANSGINPQTNPVYNRVLQILNSSNPTATQGTSVPSAPVTDGSVS